MQPTRARDSAIQAITSWPTTGRRAPRTSSPIRQLFGINVFSDEVMKARLPENIYKAIRNTIKKGAPLDPIDRRRGRCHDAGMGHGARARRISRTGFSR